MKIRELFTRTARLCLLISGVAYIFLACSFRVTSDDGGNRSQTPSASVIAFPGTVQVGVQIAYPSETPVPEPGEIIDPLTASSLKQAATLRGVDTTDFVWLPNGRGIVLASLNGLTAHASAPDAIFADAAPEFGYFASEHPTLLSVARDQAALAWVRDERVVTVWKSGEVEPRILDQAGSPITGLVISDRGSELAYSTFDGTLIVRDAEYGAILRTWQSPSWLANITYSPDGKLLSGTDLANFTVYIFNLENGEIRRELQWGDSASPALYGAYFSPNWRYLAWVARGAVQIMEVASEELGVHMSHEDFVSAIAWAPNDRLLAVAAAGTMEGEFIPLVVIWDVESGRIVNTLAQKAAVQSMAFSMDGSQLAILDNLGGLQIWVVE